MMKLINVILIVLLACSLVIVSCSEDSESPTEPGVPDPNVFCDENLCENNDDLKQKCIDTFNTCMENESDLNDDECVGMALFACRIQE